MMLFTDQPDQSKNLLPKDGVVHYHGRVFDAHDSLHYWAQLSEHIAWRNDQVVIFGKPITTKRKVAWYGDKAYQYTYSNTTKEALPWTEELLEIKQKVEHASGETYNSCLLNLYHQGDEGMAWHCDDEEDLKPNKVLFAWIERFSEKLMSPKVFLGNCFDEAVAPRSGTTRNAG